MNPWELILNTLGWFMLALLFVVAGIVLFAIIWGVGEWVYKRIQSFTRDK